MPPVGWEPPEGFDSVLHARSKSPRGFDFKPRQCDGPCGLIFIPLAVEQTICEECREPDMGKGADFTPKTKKPCKRCGTLFLPRYGAEKYCSEECRLEVDRDRWKKKRKGTTTPAAITEPAAVLPGPAPGAELIGKIMPAARELVDLVGSSSIQLTDMGIKVTIEKAGTP